MKFLECVGEYISRVAINIVCMAAIIIIPFSVGQFVGNYMGLTWALISAVVTYIVQIAIMVGVVSYEKK